MRRSHFVMTAEMHISTDPEEIIRVANLGSCLGIIMLDPFKHHCGAIHCLLPNSEADPEKATKRPAMYVDTGVSYLIETLQSLGSHKSSLKTYVAGGSAIGDANNVFQIGKRNFSIFRKIMWHHQMLITGEDVGGNQPRSITLTLATGEVTSRTGDIIKILGEGYGTQSITSR